MLKKYWKFLAVILIAVGAAAYTPVVPTAVTVNAASISLNKKSLTLAAKDRYTLKLAGAKNVSWASKNKAVASVSKKGLVTAKKAGKTVITASYKGKKYKCSVVVKTPKISNAKLQLTAGSKKQLSVLYTISRVKWKSSKPSIASVNSKGVVTAKKSGTAKITAAVNGKTLVSTVKVTKASKADEKPGLPNKKKYRDVPDNTMKTLSNGDTVAAMFNSYEVPLEARIDIFNLKHGNTRTKGTLHEYPYWLEGTELYYLEYGTYYVTSKSNLRPYKYYTESYDRVYDLFKELGILDQPDYVKAREIAVWMQTSITYGDSHSKDGTWLGIDKGVCINTASMYQEFMWLLDVPCKIVSSTKLNHAWNVVELDGKWYHVDVTAPYNPPLYGEYTNDIEREIFPIWFEEDPYTKAADEYAIGGMKNAGDAYSDGSKTLYYDTIVDVYTDLQNENSKFYQSYYNDRGISICIKNYDSNVKKHTEFLEEFIGILAEQHIGSSIQCNKMLDQADNIVSDDTNRVVSYYIASHKNLWNGYPNISTHPETYNPSIKPLSCYLT